MSALLDSHEAWLLYDVTYSHQSRHSGVIGSGLARVRAGEMFDWLNRLIEQGPVTITKIEKA